MLYNNYTRIFSPANILITAAGNLKHRQLVDLAHERFHGLRTSNKLGADRPPAAHSRLVFRSKSSLEPVHMYMGVPAYPLPHEAPVTCYVLNTILARRVSS